MLLSVDQSLSCSGLVLWGDELLWGTVKTEPKTETVTRIREIMDGLAYLIEGHDVTTVVVESLPYGINSTSVRPLAALYYFIQNLCIEMGVEFHEANVTAVKKFATGSGKAGKAEMIEAFKEAAPELHAEILAAGIKKTTGLADVADAYHIGAYYRSKDAED